MFSLISVASAAAAYNATTTVESTAYVTIPCSSTTLTYGTQTFTVSELTTLTVQDCSCTEGNSIASSLQAAHAATAAPVSSSAAAAASSPAAASSAAAPSVAAESSSAGAILANGATAAKVGAAAGVAAAVAYLL